MHALAFVAVSFGLTTLIVDTVFSLLCVVNTFGTTKMEWTVPIATAIAGIALVVVGALCL